MTISQNQNPFYFSKTNVFGGKEKAEKDISVYANKECNRCWYIKIDLTNLKIDVNKIDIGEIKKYLLI